MKTRIFYEADTADLSLQGKRIAIIGYGAQGQAHALNLRDSSCDVVVGARLNGRGWQEAVRDQFEPKTVVEAVAGADLICLMMPDEIHGDVFRGQILPNAKPGFIAVACHGLASRRFTYSMGFLSGGMLGRTEARNLPARGQCAP